MALIYIFAIIKFDTIQNETKCISHKQHATKKLNIHMQEIYGHIGVST